MPHPICAQVLADDDSLRQTALQQLPTFQFSPEWSGILMHLLATIQHPPAPIIQRRAVQALLWVEDEGLIESLIELASQPHLRPLVIRALGRYDDPDAYQRVVAALHDGGLDVQEGAILGLGDGGRSSAVAPLMRYIETHRHRHDTLNLVALAVHVLGKIGDKRAIEPLEALLVEVQGDTRIAVEQALAKLR